MSKIKKNNLFEITQADWKGELGNQYRAIEPEVLKKYRVTKSNKLSDIENSFQFNRDLQRGRKTWWAKNADQEFFNSPNNENIVALHGISSYGTIKFKTYKELKKDYDVFYNPTKIQRNEQSTIGVILNKDTSIPFPPSKAFDDLIQNNAISYGLGDVILHFWPRRITNASSADNWSETFGLYKKLGKDAQTAAEWYQNNPDILKQINFLKQQIQGIKNIKILSDIEKEELTKNFTIKLKDLIRKQADERQKSFNYFDFTKSSGTRKNPISYLNSSLLQNDQDKMDEFNKAGVSNEAIGNTQMQSILSPNELRKSQTFFGEMLVGNAKIKDVFTQTEYVVYENFVRENTQNGVIDDTTSRNINSELFDSLLKLKFFADYGVPCFDFEGNYLNNLLDHFTFKSVLPQTQISENTIRILIRQKLLKKLK